MSRNKSIQISVILVLSLFLSSFNIMDGIHSAGSNENIAPLMPVTNTPTETTIPTYTEIPTETATQTFTEEPTATETPSISATPTFTETLPITDTPTLTPTQIQTITETPTVTPTMSPTVTPTATETSSQACIGIGTYDDSDANITYSTGWTSQTLSGAFNNTEHYSSTIGSTAAFCVTLPKASTISIIYRAHYVFGTMDISIDGDGDGNDYDFGINQNASSQALLRRWDSPSLEAGNYTVTLTHNTGTYVTLDAVIANDPVQAGTYDDMDTPIFYSAGWTSQSIPGDYQDTEHYSMTPGSTASLTFQLTQPGIVSILYRSASAFGDMSASIDGGFAYNFSQYSLDWVYQNQWDSALLSPGIHTLTLTHVNGAYILLDAIIVNSSPVLNNFHDDASYEISYSGDWTPQVMQGAYANTEYYSSTIGSTASYTHNFTASGTFSVIYRADSGLGIAEVFIDGDSVGTIDQSASEQGLMRRWASSPVEAGPHTITVVHNSGTWITLDAFLIDYPVPDGTYDDMNTNIFYSAGWSSQTIAGDYQDTEHYSTTAGSTASLTFQLTQPGIVSILYRSASAFGDMSASIDGGFAYNFSQYSSDWVYQNQWDSALLSPGIHTLTLTHVNGAYILLDAIIVNSSPVLDNFHDDASYEISYSGDWTPQVMQGAYANTEYYSSTIGSTASYTHNFSTPGSFSVIYRAYPNFGIMEVLIDNISVGYFDQDATNQGLLQRWISDTIEAGTHTITVVHNSGPCVTLDAFLIDYPVGNGTFDDSSSDIYYSAGWTAYTLTGDYSSTEHYSSTIGSMAALTFTLDRESIISILYRTNSQTDIMNVSIDGNLIGTFDQTSSNETFQRRWNSPLLASGNHTLTLTHADGMYVTLDAILVDQPANESEYDDTSTDIDYSENWIAYTLSGDYDSTEHYSTAIGSTASLAFELDYESTITILYRVNQYTGEMGITIDDEEVDSIDQTSTTEKFQQSWTSDELDSGVHTLVLTHDTGQYVTLDAILIP